MMSTARLGSTTDADSMAEWRATLPARVRTLDALWRFASLEPLEHTGQCSWIGACTLTDGTEGILKLAFPHPEGRDEVPGLEACDGEPMVRLLRARRGLDALLLERLVHGNPLSDWPEPEQDPIIGDLLRRLRRVPITADAFRPLGELVDLWRGPALEPGARDEWDAGLVARGLAELDALLATSPAPCLLATDLHAGNVLAATRAPWLAIDPKPYAGDPAFDVTQHLLNCPTRLRIDPERTIVGAHARCGLGCEDRRGRTNDARRVRDRLARGARPSSDRRRTERELVPPAAGARTVRWRRDARERRREDPPGVARSRRSRRASRNAPVECGSHDRSPSDPGSRK